MAEISSTRAKLRAHGVPDDWNGDNLPGDKHGLQRAIVCWPAYLNDAHDPRSSAQGRTCYYCVARTVDDQWWLTSNAGPQSPEFVEPIGPFPDFNSAQAAWHIVAWG
jgi:hypothetical protein